MPASQSLPRYDTEKSYRWNYEHAPCNGSSQAVEGIDVPQIGGNWTYCGRPVSSPLGIAAGPLLNGRWILYYAALGFDILTYKTTRSRARDCYSLPNLQPVESTVLSSSGRRLAAAGEMDGSWAVSFGMPSMSPDVWRADVEWTRRRLPKEKLLAVSVVATVEPNWSLDEMADDFGRCARWAVESGADCVETNFSCPNVSTSDGQLYQQPRAAALVAERVREAIGNIPYVIKVGFFDDSGQCEQLLDAVAPFASALAMTNCIAATIEQADGRPLFGAQPRGIGGDSIRDASVVQVRRFAEIARQRGFETKIIGVGGISSATHVEQYLAAGAEAVQLATSPMINPLVAVEILTDLARSHP